MRNFFLLLLVAVLIAGGGFLYQLKKSQDITIKQTTTPLISVGYTDIPIESDDVFLGNPGAAVTVVFFGDFTNKKSIQSLFSIIKITKENPQDLRLVWKNIPVGGLFLKENLLPHNGAFCAGKQNAYWDFVEKLIAINKTASNNDLYKIADELKLNLNDWQKCLIGNEAKQKIDRDKSFANSIGIAAGPVVFINNKKINIEDGVNLEDLITQTIKKD